MNRSKDNLFLMEMMMSVGFLILCIGICISVFVKADAMSRNAGEMNQAVLLAQSTVETLKTKGTSALEDLASGRDGDAYTLYWNRNGEIVKPADSTIYGDFDSGEDELSFDGYRGVVTVRPEDALQVVDITIYVGGSERYQLTASVYEREKADGKV